LICNLDGVGLTGDDTGPVCADPEIALLSFGSNADRRHPCPSNADPDRTGTVAYGPSPFPHLDAFFSALVQNNGRGRIKSWLTYPRSDGDPEAGECPHCAIGHVLYNIVDNRFCLNVGREHKSNGIYFVCHLAQGLYYQKCYDAADCPNFRSPAFHIPPEVLPRCIKDGIGPCIIAPVSAPVAPFPVTSLLPRGRAPLQIIGTNATSEGVRSTMAARLAATLTKGPAADPDVSLRVRGASSTPSTRSPTATPRRPDGESTPSVVLLSTPPTANCVPTSSPAPSPPSGSRDSPPRTSPSRSNGAVESSQRTRRCSPT
jgi:hypothetical protein